MTTTESKPVPVLIEIIVRTEIKPNPSIADLNAINAKAADLVKLASEYGEVEGHVVIGKQKFKLAE